MNLEPLEIKDDPRGSLVEAYKLPNDGQVFYVLANPHEARGNHYHLRKTERFLVLFGSAVISVKNRETNDIMNVEVTGLKPMVVTISPNHTHVLVPNEGGCIFLVWCDEIFNPEDADTYPEEL